MESPNYYAIIPAKVRYDENLTPNVKLFYGEITALSNKEKRCFASNKYFAKLYNVSERSITNWIAQLVKYGYIETENEYQNNSKVIARRNIYLTEGGIEKNFGRGIEKNFEGGIEKNFGGGIEKNFEDNSTSILNDTSNNNSILVAPQFSEVIKFFLDNGYHEEAAKIAYDWYNDRNWIDSKDNPVKNWKLKMRKIWFTDKNKIENYTKSLTTPKNSYIAAKSKQEANHKAQEEFSKSF
ncbi:MAG: helix-turn-helix domain-containing protein [Bacteroidetes bacterium]|nr:helix-turn-helix domain-containing protein [Bacteroidota bacterium]